MCIPAMLAVAGSTMGIGAAGAATAAGATAGAATAGAAAGASGLATLGTMLSVGGSLLSGVQSYQAGQQQAAYLKAQAESEKRLSAVKDNRTRAQFQTAMRQQMAELAGRGIQLDSPTAVLLGQTAAQELSFESQAIRSEGLARVGDISAAGQIARGRARAGLMQGTFSAAGSVVTAAPQLWPELLKWA